MAGVVSYYICISTHALTEGDADQYSCLNHLRGFQLTPSRRATCRNFLHQILQIFQLTPSRRATRRNFITYMLRKISTHALTEGDIHNNHLFTYKKYFNSRPHGGRQRCSMCNLKEAFYFNSRPHGGRRLSGLLFTVFL